LPCGVVLTSVSVCRTVGHMTDRPQDHHMNAPTAKQLAALQHFVVNQNKTEAYKHAYDTDDMHPRTINREAIRLFKSPVLESMVLTMQQQAAENIGVSVEWVLHRAKLLADFNLKRFLYVDGDGAAYYDFTQATEDDWYCISEYCVDIVQKGAGEDKYEAERIKIKGEAKLKALEMVAKLGGMQGYNNKLEIGGSVAVLNLSTDEYLAAREQVIEHDDC